MYSRSDFMTINTFQNEDNFPSFSKKNPPAKGRQRKNKETSSENPQVLATTDKITEKKKVLITYFFSLITIQKIHYFKT